MHDPKAILIHMAHLDRDFPYLPCNSHSVQHCPRHPGRALSHASWVESCCSRLPHWRAHGQSGLILKRDALDRLSQHEKSEYCRSCPFPGGLSHRGSERASCVFVNPIYLSKNFKLADGDTDKEICNVNDDLFMDPRSSTRLWLCTAQCLEDAEKNPRSDGLFWRKPMTRRTPSILTKPCTGVPALGRALSLTKNFVGVLMYRGQRL